MEQNAIKRIEELVAAASDRLPKTDIPFAVMPGEASPTSLERFLDGPTRMRAVFMTERISDFVNYTLAEADGDSAVFINPHGGGAVAIMDYGRAEKPMWASYRAELNMVHSPEFAALLKATENPTGQRELIDFLEDWRYIIEPYALNEETEHRDSLSVAQAIAKLRKVDLKAIMDTAHEERDFRSARATLASVEAGSGQDKLPAGFTFKCYPYPDTKPRDIDVRLSIRTGGDKPMFLMRIVGKAALQHDIAEEVEFDIVSRIRHGKDEPIPVYIGTPKINQPG